jgi:alpha-beta hydrolase superfamily lysophospholipase
MRIKETTGDRMGLITERGSAADGFEAVPVPLASGEAAESGGVMLRRRSALPTRRSVLCLHTRPDTFVPEDLAGWYTERGFHFYVADLRPEEGQRADRSRAGRFARLDAACRCLREAEGHDMIILAADSADAATAAQWCDERRERGGPDALILSSPVFGRRLRRGLDIGCPVLVLSAADGQASGRPRPRRSKDPRAIKLGPHVTWLRLDAGLDGQTDGAGQAGHGGQAPGRNADRRQFFDEMGRWLGAYMYGGVRDQLL